MRAMRSWNSTSLSFFLQAHSPTLVRCHSQRHGVKLGVDCRGEAHSSIFSWFLVREGPVPLPPEGFFLVFFDEAADEACAASHLASKHATATHAPPTIALQHRRAQGTVTGNMGPENGSMWGARVDDADSPQHRLTVVMPLRPAAPEGAHP